MVSDSATWQGVSSLLATPLTVIDIGARAGIDVKLSALAPNVRIYGFEPDAVECARLDESADSVTEYLPLALWSDVGEQPFYIAEDPMCSCVYPPIEELTTERPRLAQLRTRERISIAVRTIDDWTRERAIDRLDYLKIDAQGAELAILEGAPRALDRVRALKLEVQFNALYEGVPLFGEVDRHLRERGFRLWRLSELSHCGFAGMSAAKVAEHLDYDDQRVHLIGGGGQLLWGDAYFVREEVCSLSSDPSWEDAIRDACLAWAHGYTDLAEVSLRRSLAKAPPAGQEILRSALNDASGPTPDGIA